MKIALRWTLAAVAGLLVMQLTQAQSGPPAGELPLTTRPLQFTGVAEAEVRPAELTLRTGELRFTGTAGN